MVRKNGLGKGLDSLIPSTGHKKAAPAKPEVKKEVVVTVNSRMHIVRT